MNRSLAIYLAKQPNAAVFFLFFVLIFIIIIIIISTRSIDIHCSSTYSKIKSQKGHTRYLISSQGILHFTKQLKNVDMFRVCN